MAKEKNPTIPSALPAFERMRQTWEQMQSDLPETEALIQPGLDKLAEYCHYADINPTYIIATSKSQYTDVDRKLYFLRLTYLLAKQF